MGVRSPDRQPGVIAVFAMALVVVVVITLPFLGLGLLLRILRGIRR